jgi:hypothetical protein
LEKKYKHLAALSFLYVWMYDAFPLLLAIAFLHMLAVAITERRFEYRPVLFVVAGIVLGLVINPYFPDNIIFSFRHMLPKLTDATALQVGNEWFPYDTRQLLRNSFPALVAFASGALALGLSGRKMDLRTALTFLVTLFFGLMLFQARRFVEYFPVFALIFAAFAWTPLFLDPPPTAPTDQALSSPQFILRRNVPFLILSFAIVISLVWTLPPARSRMHDLKPHHLYAGASKWLEQNTPNGELVFQTDWDDFPRLFFYNTHNTYLIGLDPTYMQIYDPELYDLWVMIARGEVNQPSQFIATVFRARYVHTDLSHTRFLMRAENDPGLVEVYRDGQNVIFKVTREK